MSDLSEMGGLSSPPGSPINTMKQKPAAVLDDRITVVETVTHQQIQYAEQPKSFSTSYTRTLKQSDQPYSRKIKVTDDWTPLDLGWAKEWPSVGMILIQNDEGRNYGQTLPTDKEKQDAKARVIELQANNDSVSWLIQPGDSFRGSPGDVKGLLLRCRSGNARATLTLFPA